MEQSNKTIRREHKDAGSSKGLDGKLEEVLSMEFDKKINSSKNMGSNF